MRIFRGFLDSQLWLSKKFDNIFLSEHFSVVGWREFYRSRVPAHFIAGLKIYDIGSGKRPVSQWVNDEHAKATSPVTGIDIDEQELRNAPQGAYAEEIVADICSYQGSEDGDLAICGCLLEHVNDMKQALRCVKSTLKIGGTLLIFIPNRNAVFAKLNRLLPEGIKRRVLNMLYPKTEAQYIGFPAYYNQCTPRDIKIILDDLDMQVIGEEYYHYSNYMMFFTPAHILWRIYQRMHMMFSGRAEACENFIIVARKS